MKIDEELAMQIIKELQELRFPNDLAIYPALGHYKYDGSSDHWYLRDEDDVLYTLKGLLLADPSGKRFQQQVFKYLLGSNPKNLESLLNLMDLELAPYKEEILILMALI